MCSGTARWVAGRAQEGLAVQDRSPSSQVVNPAHNDADTVAIRALNEKMSRDPRVEYALVPIGDGVGMAWKK